jgi:hypothetical protein
MREKYRYYRNYAFRKLSYLDWKKEYIFNRDWDVLIILDGCRTDALESVNQEFGFLPAEIPNFRSVASSSLGWMQKNFNEDFKTEQKQTTLVSANPFTEQAINDNWLQNLDEVWKYGWDDSHGTVPARHVTDRAIDMARNIDTEQLVVHYMQPHFPSIPQPLGSGMDLDKFGSEWDSVWERLQYGNISKKVVWNSYLKNLEYVLNDVELLLQNLAASSVVISADHGNAFGEWGLYGHPDRIPISAIRNVPWVEVSAEDTNTYQPNFEKKSVSSDNRKVENRLENLGYVE